MAMTDTPTPEPLNEKQPFENYPKLAAHIADFAWKMQGISLAKWNRFLADLNDALRANGTDVTRPKYSADPAVEADMRRRIDDE